MIAFDLRVIVFYDKIIYMSDFDENGHDPPPIQKVSIYIFPAISAPRSGIIIVYQRKGSDNMMDEKDAWNSFFQSGSVLDYLQYKSIQYAKNGGEVKEDKDEVQDQGADTPTAEYR